MRSSSKSEVTMHAAAYFVPSAGHVQKMHVPFRADVQGARFTVAPSIDERESKLLCASKLLLVAVLHAGLFGWLANVDTTTRENQTPVRLDVRTIEISLASAAVPVTNSTEAAPVMDRQGINRQKKSAPPKQVKARPTSDRRVSSFAVPAATPQAAATGKLEEASAAAETTPGTAGASVSTPASSAIAGAGTSSAAIYDADYLRNPAPEYPSASRRSREQGKVRLDVTVTPEGRASDIRIRQSSGYERLDDAALATVRSWRFVAARRGSEAVTAQVIVPIEFRLAD
jgi:periplasmic protein TonB